MMSDVEGISILGSWQMSEWMSEEVGLPAFSFQALPLSHFDSRFASHHLPISTQVSPLALSYRGDLLDIAASIDLSVVYMGSYSGMEIIMLVKISLASFAFFGGHV